MPTAKLYSTVAALPNHRGIMRAGHIRDSATSFLPGAQSRKGVGWGGGTNARCEGVGRRRSDSNLNAPGTESTAPGYRLGPHRGPGVSALSSYHPSPTVTHALLGHYHAELHEAEAPPEDIQSSGRYVCFVGPGVGTVMETVFTKHFDGYIPPLEPVEPSIAFTDDPPHTQTHDASIRRRPR